MITELEESRKKYPANIKFFSHKTTESKCLTCKFRTGGEYEDCCDAMLLTGLHTTSYHEQYESKFHKPYQKDLVFMIKECNIWRPITLEP